MERLTRKNPDDGQMLCWYDCEKCIDQEEDGGCGYCPHFAKMCEKLKAYEDAEEQGLLLRLPFKIGDSLFWIATECDAGKNTADACDIYDCDDCPHSNTLVVVEGKVREQHIMRVIQGTIEDKIGKDYFLTQAEKALADLQSK